MAYGPVVNARQLVSMSFFKAILLLRHMISNFFAPLVELTRASKCGECSACLRSDCRRCIYCRDKSRYGGPNILKQACIEKRVK